MSVATVLAWVMPGFQEWLVLLVLGLLLFGRRLPEVARQIGKSVVQLRRGLHDFKAQIDADESLREVKTTVQSVQRDFTRALDAPREIADPRRVLADLTDPNQPAAAVETSADVEAAPPSPGERPPATS